ncbi:MAG TPA: hypothetical protein GXX28_07555 [Firmicutes bacterium]|nr:hypothetical protein [Bacillota bacterium]
MKLDNGRRFFPPASRQSLLRLIVQRMQLADGDLAGRQEWAERVRREWPGEGYEGGLAVPLSELKRLSRPA